VPHVEVGVEDADDERATALTRGLPDVPLDQVGIEVGAEDRLAVPHQTFEVVPKAAYPLVIDAHAREVPVVGERQRQHGVGVRGSSVQFRHGFRMAGALTW
jgi:hypothetical protein